MITRTQRFKPDVAQLVTDQIIEALERGVIPWKKPWRKELPRNITGRHYHGVNLLLLALSPHASPFYLTFKQANELGGMVRAKSSGFRVIYWRILEHLSPEGEITTIPLLKYYTVFNLEQTTGIPEERLPKLSEQHINPIGECEQVWADMPNKPALLSAQEAFYERKSDTVGIPPIDRFVSAEEYHSTLFHELVHSTGHPKRCNRDNRYGELGYREAYSTEELIAEIGSSFLCANTGIAPRTINNQASYISYWLARLKSDKRLIISAAAAAQKASDYILHLPGEINFNQCTWLGDYYAN